QLDLADAEPGELRERGVAGTEVVEADAYAELDELGHGGCWLSGLARQNLLVDLQPQRVGRQVVPLEGLPDDVGEVSTVQVPGRKVDADLDRQVAVPPPRGLAERLVDNLFGQVADQVRLLSEPDELRCGQHAAVRVPPPCE